MSYGTANYKYERVGYTSFENLGVVKLYEKNVTHFLSKNGEDFKHVAAPRNRLVIKNKSGMIELGKDLLLHLAKELRWIGRDHAKRAGKWIIYYGPEVAPPVPKVERVSKFYYEMEQLLDKKDDDGLKQHLGCPNLPKNKSTVRIDAPVYCFRCEHLHDIHKPKDFKKYPSRWTYQYGSIEAEEKNIEERERIFDSQ